VDSDRIPRKKQASQEQIMKKALLACLATLLIGCGADVTPPPTSSVNEIKGRTLAQIARMEEGLVKGDVGRVSVRRLAQSLRFLAGHMENTGAGTVEQHQGLRNLADQLHTVSGQMVMPDFDSPDNAPTVQPRAVMDRMRRILQEARTLAGSVPDSDLRRKSDPTPTAP
jgi:hypothetical protein